MILAGDEFSRTQNGNNNTYCQDNELSWINWNLSDTARDLLEFTSRAIHLRKEHPVLRRKRFFQGRTIFGASKDILWLEPDGTEMVEETWKKSKTRTIGMMLVGDAMDEFNEHGERITDDTFLVMLNANPEPIQFTVPSLGGRWEMVVSSQKLDDNEKVVVSADKFKLEGRSTVVLRKAF